MSRENDNPSSGPQGRGGDAAYPSGTPPYPSAGAGAEGDDTPKTETTLTTRIRINIPGSRPIPPVVMRTPVDSSEGADGRDGAEAGRAPLPQRPASTSAAVGASAGGTGAGAAAGAQTATGSAGDGEEEKTSDWFAPRKPSGQTSGGQTPSPAPSSGAPADQGNGASYPAGTPGAGSGRPPGTGPLGDLPPGFPVPHAAEEPEDRNPSDTPRQGTPSFPDANPLTANTPADAPPLRPDQTSGHGFATGDPASANPVRPDGLPSLPTRQPGGAGKAPTPPAAPSGPTSG
ncbi:hypothetical protein G5C51_40925, partial [Streptomyces sp. A7024]|nr:hypothetical protein [Streptomyces coryli]